MTSVSPTAAAPAVPAQWHHGSSAPLDAAPLLALLGASKPEQVDGAIVAAFRARHEGVAAARRDILAKELGVTQMETDAVRKSRCAQAAGE